MQRNLEFARTMTYIKKSRDREEIKENIDEKKMQEDRNGQNNKKKKRKISLFTFENYKNLKLEMLKYWGQEKICILDFIILSIGE